MKKIISAAILYLLCISAKAQQASNLDIKYGFNKFDLGSTVSVNKGVASIIKVYSDNPKFESYNVNYPSNFKLFGYAPKTIVLDFYNGLLTQILITMPRYESLNESLLINTKIVDGLGKLYGKWQDMEPSGNMLVIKSIIRKKTALFFQTYMESANKGDTFSYVSIPLLTISESK